MDGWMDGYMDGWVDCILETSSENEKSEKHCMELTDENIRNNKGPINAG